MRFVRLRKDTHLPKQCDTANSGSFDPDADSAEVKENPSFSALSDSMNIRLADEGKTRPAFVPFLEQIKESKTPNLFLRNESPD
jgi:hypothetical protein